MLSKTAQVNDILKLLLASLAGLVLGEIFFGGLWLTVQRGLSSQRLVLWFLGGLLLRMRVALAGFHFVADGYRESLLARLSGFPATLASSDLAREVNTVPPQSSSP
jgi:F1F0 ATPase subunit 2